MTFAGSPSTPYSEKSFVKWMLALKETQDSIQSLSSWCVQHRTHYKEIVNLWLKQIKKVKINQRLRLFYLANDIIQVSKRKHINGFVEYWANVLPEVVPLVRDEKLKKSIQRIFTVWNERMVYNDELIDKLNDLLAENDQAPSCEPEAAGEFDAAKLRQCIDQCDKCRKESDSRLERLGSMGINGEQLEEFRKNLRERRQGDHYVQEFEDSAHYIEGYVEVLTKELTATQKLLRLLETCHAFYLEQKGEAKYVANAYKNYSQKVKSVKKRLDSMTDLLPDVSPVPSPDINAPSPTPEDDFDLPDDDVSQETNGSLNLNYDMPSSFIGSGTDITNLLSSIQGLDSKPQDSSTFDSLSLPENDKDIPVNNTPIVRSIEVLDSQSSGLKGISDFFKNMGASLNLPTTFNSLLNTPVSAEVTPTGNSSGKASDDTSTPPPSLPYTYQFDKAERKIDAPSPKWNSTLLPSKIPTWSQNLVKSSDSENSWSNDKCDALTPQSPTEYQPPPKDMAEDSNKSNEWLPVFSSGSPGKDVDHRNLISLTGATDGASTMPGDVDQRVNLWTSVDVDQRVGQNGLPQTHYGDIDHRLISNPPPPPPPVENYENNSVEMDIGGDDDDTTPMPLPPPPPIPASLIDITKPPPNVWQSVLPPPPFANLLNPPPPPDSMIIPMHNTIVPPPLPPSLSSIEDKKTQNNQDDSLPLPDVLSSIPMPSQISQEGSDIQNEVLCIGSRKAMVDKSAGRSSKSLIIPCDERETKCSSPEVQFIKNEPKRPSKDSSDRKLTDLKDKWRTDSKIDWSSPKRRRRDHNDRHSSSSSNNSYNSGKTYDNDYHSSKSHRRRSSKH